MNNKIKAIYRRLNTATGGRLEIVSGAIRSFGKARGAEAAAGLAYYALFSLFPLLLALVAIGSTFLESQEVMEQVTALISEAIPVSDALVEQNFEQVLSLRGAVGLAGLVGTLWSASGAFASLSRNINRAWTGAEPRNPLQSRLVALTMIGTLLLLLLLSVAFSTTLSTLSRLEIPLLGSVSIYQAPLWTLLSNLVPFAVTLLLFMLLYRWVPRVDVPWRAAFWAALVVAAAWEVAGNAFAWYVGSGMSSYQVVYGSLGTVVALLFWIYLSSWIILFGAHLSAAIGQYHQNRS
jgi:membrane protein